MTTQAYEGLKSEAFGVHTKLRGAFDDPEDTDWTKVVILSERLIDLAERIGQERRRLKTLEWVRANAAPAREQDCR